MVEATQPPLPSCICCVFFSSARKARQKQTSYPRSIGARSDTTALEQSQGQDAWMYVAKQLTYLRRGTEKAFWYLFVHALFGSNLGAFVEASFTGVQQHLAMPFTAKGWHGRKKLEEPSVSSSCGSTLPSVWSFPKGKSRGFECSLSKHLEQTLGICRNHRVYS